MKTEMKQAARFFYVGDKMEFHADGDICVITRTYSLRGKRRVEYKSLKTGKKYSDIREALMRYESEGAMKYIPQ